jgi:hypothetical protein
VLLLLVNSVSYLSSFDFAVTAPKTIVPYDVEGFLIW